MKTYLVLIAKIETAFNIMVTQNAKFSTNKNNHVYSIQGHLFYRNNTLNIYVTCAHWIIDAVASFK